MREQREHARLSLRQLAQLAGVSNPYLSQVERGLRKPSAEVLQQIARGLQISAEALYVRAGILESDQKRPDVEAAVQADADLSDRQKRVLLDIFNAFRAENARASTAEKDIKPVPSRRRTAKRAAAGEEAAGEPAADKPGRRPRRTRKATSSSTVAGDVAAVTATTAPTASAKTDRTTKAVTSAETTGPGGSPGDGDKAAGTTTTPNE